MIKDKKDWRRWEEAADARMVQEDHRAMANLSPIPVNREIPHHDKPRYGTAALEVVFHNIVQNKSSRL